MKIKLLQWNIWCNENIDNIIHELKRINTDIVCIQELSYFNNDRTYVNKLLDVYPYHYYEVADTFTDGRSQGNAILSKYPLVNSFKEYVQQPSDNKNDYSKEGRVYIEVGIIINNHKLIIGTTHLSYTDRFKETLLKDEEIDNLLNILKRNAHSFIFTGDLNCHKDSKYIKQISEILEYHETKNTWTTKPFSYNGFNENDLNWKLDYVFTTKDIIISNIEVVKTDYSDHLPILVEITY